MQPIKYQVVSQRLMNQVKRQVEISLIDGNLDLSLLNPLCSPDFASEVVEAKFQQTFLIFEG